jgi:hypothetical protein
VKTPCEDTLCWPARGGPASAASVPGHRVLFRLMLRTAKDQVRLDTPMAQLVRLGIHRVGGFLSAPPCPGVWPGAMMASKAMKGGSSWGCI